MKIKKYLKVWYHLAANNFSIQTSSRLSSALFIFGKLIRLAFFLIFLLALFTHTQSLAGYSIFEVVLFFMTFNLIDITAQFFFRGFYIIEGMVKHGDLDFILIKPINPLFRLANQIVDFLDFFTLLSVVAVLWITIDKLAIFNFPNFLIYIFLCLMGIAIAFAIHVFVAAVAVLTQQVEQVIWIYRDLMTMGRFPVEIYAFPLQFLLTLLVPVAVMVSFPAKAMLGILSWEWIVYAVFITGVFLFASIKFWDFSLRHYSSASS